VAVNLHAYDSAIAALRNARELLPKDSGVLIKLARVLQLSGQEAEATGIYREVLGVDPGNGIALLNHAMQLSAANGDLDVAEACAELASRLLPESPEASDTLGWIYVKRGLTEPAVGLLKQVVSEAPFVSTYHFHLAMALFQARDIPGVKSELQSALNCNPADDERESIERMIALSEMPR
jgi:cytochrome c-type biogenesis protein CcmH/NrfG